MHTLVGWLSGFGAQTGAVASRKHTTVDGHIGEVAMSEGVRGIRAMPHLCIHLTPEDKSWKNLSQGIPAVPS